MNKTPHKMIIVAIHSAQMLEAFPGRNCSYMAEEELD